MLVVLAKIWLKLWRWRAVPPDYPVPERCVMIAAPHTSNWDFPLTLALAEVSGVRIRWLGKKSLFKGPMGPVMRRLGGIAIDRSSSQGMVSELANEFKRHDRLVLVVPVEGSRSKGDYWKSGFYRIAEQAQVPIVCSFVDRSTRTGGFGPSFVPSGDLTADMDLVRGFYAGKTGLNPPNTGVPRLRDEVELEAN